jgi:hypothetical protein
MNTFTLHILFLGIASFQALFMLIQWFFFKRKEYIFYIAYIISSIVFILCRINESSVPQLMVLPHWVNKVTYQPLGIFSYWMYLCFARSFLNVKKKQTKVYEYTFWLQGLFIGFMMLSFLLMPFEIDKKNLALVYLAGYIPMLLLSIPMFILMLRQKDMLNNFLVLGCFFYVAGGFTGMILNYTLNSFEGKKINIFFAVEIGILAELLLLNTGFLLKNKIMQQQALKGQQKIMQHFIEAGKKKRGST